MDTNAAFVDGNVGRLTRPSSSVDTWNFMASRENLLTVRNGSMHSPHGHLPQQSTRNENAVMHGNARRLSCLAAVAAASFMGISFPINILVVDENDRSLTSVVNLVKSCGYMATMAKNASEAFALLCQDAGQPAINLVMVDAYLRHDMDVFKFLRIINFQFNLPVIMMLHNGELTNQFVCKAIDAGACKCLLRPIRLEEIKILWQHVMIRRHNAFNSFQEKPTMQMSLGHTIPPYVQSLPQSDPNIGRECPAAIQLDTTDGKSPLFQENIDNIRHSPVLQKCDAQIKELEPPRKKQRIKWNDKPFLERKFILAVEQLGIDKATPIKILELMNEKDLTRENVSSHLQKYKLRLNKEKQQVLRERIDPVSIPQEAFPSNNAQQVQLTNSQIISTLQTYQSPACPMVEQPPLIIQSSQQNSPMVDLPMGVEDQQPIYVNEELTEEDIDRMIDEINGCLLNEPSKNTGDVVANPCAVGDGGKQI